MSGDEPQPFHAVNEGTSAPARITRARMPETAERARLEKRRAIREVVFGAQDGLLTSMGIVTGVGVANPDRATVLLSGLVALIVGALSMGVGEYLGGKSEREVVQNAIMLERREMEEQPEEEFAEQVGYYRQKGFTPEEAEMIVRRLVLNPDVYFNEMMRDEFGIDPREAEEQGLRATLAMAGSFAIGAFIPLIPYFLPIDHKYATIDGGLCAALALFSIGAFAGKLSGRNMGFKGLELVAYGALVFAASLIAGHLIPALFGHPPVPAGG